MWNSGRARVALQESGHALQGGQDSLYPAASAVVAKVDSFSVRRYGLDAFLSEVAGLRSHARHPQRVGVVELDARRLLAVVV
jgi:hypothetical protein